MKSNIIRTAWDTVNPTADQKARMRAALEAQLDEAREELPVQSRIRSVPREEDLELDLTLPHRHDYGRPARNEPDSGKKRAKSQPRYYTYSSPKKKNRLGQVMAAAAVLALVSTGSLFLLRMNAGTPESALFALPTEQGETASGDYDQILAVYAKALAEGWDADRCAGEGISEGIALSGLTAEQLGYATLDLDGDGQAELVVTDGTAVYDLYTMGKTGSVVHLLSSDVQTSYEADLQNNIYQTEQVSQILTDYRLYHLQDGQLEMEYHLRFAASSDTGERWSKADGNGELQSIGTEDALALTGEFRGDTLLYTPFAETGAEETEPTESQDPELLRAYADSIPGALENYHKSEEKTFCFYDCDSDGQEELLLGAGDSIFGILQPMTGNESFITFSQIQGDGYSYLCQGNVFESTAYAQGYYHYEYYTLADDLSTSRKLAYVYHDMDQDSWYKGEEERGSGDTSITAAEAESIRAAYPRLELDWKPLSEFPVTVSQGSALFEQAFVPVATGATANSQEAFTDLLDSLGFTWTNVEGMTSCYDPEYPDSWLSGTLGEVNGETIVFELTYCRVAEDGNRYADVRFEEDGPHYYTRADRLSAGVRANTLYDLRSFLFSQDKTLPLRAVVEGFARAYFSNDLNGMEEFLTEDQLPVTQEDLPETDESIVIEKITGLEETVEGYQPGVESVVSVCIVDFQEANRDSFAYLTLGVDMVNGQWKVSGYGMEK